MEEELQSRTIDIPGDGMMFRDLTVMPSTVNEEARTVEVTWSTGATVRRYSWWSDKEWTEELSMDKRHVSLDRLNNKAPLLADHRAYSIDAVRGVVEKAWLNGQAGMATVRFAKDEDSEKVWAKVRDGILGKISIGYAVRTWEITKTEGKPDHYRAIDWEPYEISLVAVPADDGASVRSAQASMKFVTTFIESVRTMDKEINPNGGGGTPTALTQAELDAQVRQAAEQASATERSRAKEINELTRMAKLPTAFAEDHIAKGTDLNTFRQLVIEEFGKADPNEGARSGGAGGPDVRMGADERDKFRSAATDGLLLRAGGPAAAQVKDPNGVREFRAMSPKDLAKECLERSGTNTRGMSPYEIWESARNIPNSNTRALGTSDFPFILQDSMRKSLEAAYEEAAPTFRPWTTREDLPDFREMTSVRMGDASPLLPVAEGAEYSYGTTTESKSSWRIFKYGRLLQYTFEMWQNGDLGAWLRLAPNMGRQIPQLQSNIVYSLLLANPVLPDGDPLFHANHNNLGTVGAPSENTLSEVRKKMMLHRTMGDGSSAGMIMNLQPRFLIVGPEQHQASLKVVEGIIVPNTVAEVNTVRGMGLTIIPEGRITGKKWFAAADPGLVDTITYGFLSGEPEVRMTEEESFNVDAFTLKVRSFFGATTKGEHRGLFYNAGE